MIGEKRYPCPCCGGLTYPVPPEEDIGGYICDICWWENDPFIRSDDEPSDQNHGITLCKGRENFDRSGISYPQLVIGWAEHEIKPFPELIRIMCRKATAFQIHCRKEETEEIALALRWGEKKDFPRDCGVVIEGEVTESFVDFLASLPAPENRDDYDRRTPFFTICLNNGYRIERYGTENYRVD